MKYSYTTLKIVNIFILLFVGIFSSNLYSQTNTDSPYSKYGLGLMKPANFNGNFGLGGAGIAWRPFSYKPVINDSLAKNNPSILDRKTNYINPVNPASFSNISLTTFEASIGGSLVSHASSEDKMTSNSAYFNHMALAFPIKENWGAGFGIMPYSSVGYNYVMSRKIANGEVANFDYRGSGGLNKVFLGSAVEIAGLFSVGATASYIFGDISTEKRVIFPSLSQTFNSVEVTDLAIGDFSFQLGLQKHFDLNAENRMTLGATAGIGDELRAKGSTILRSYVGQIGNETFVDTVFETGEHNLSVALPMDYGVGIAYERKGKWIVMADYKLRQWNDESYTSMVKNSNSHLFHLAFESLAEYNGIGNYLGRLGCRAGIHYNSSLLSIDGHAIPEYGISFGTSLPLRKTFSMIVMGFEIGKRGTKENGLIEEKFINLHFGVTINDKWFIQSKYD